MTEVSTSRSSVRRSYRCGFYIRSSLVFYQATVSEDGLLVLRDLLGVGRLRRRSGGMSDLTITNRMEIAKILAAMRPHVVFKRRQVEQGLLLLDRLPPPRDRAGFLRVCEFVDDFASLNFSKSRTVTAETVRTEFEKHGCCSPCND